MTIAEAVADRVETADAARAVLTDAQRARQAALWAYGYSLLYPGHVYHGATVATWARRAARWAVRAAAAPVGSSAAVRARRYSVRAADRAVSGAMRAEARQAADDVRSGSRRLPFVWDVCRYSGDER